jgi:predicted nucleotidyltransferase
VTELLEEFVTSVQGSLRNNLVGVYLRGSLAIGDFNPETSDVDVLVVTQRQVSDAEFEALSEMHDRLRTIPNRYAEKLEVAYIDAAAAKRFQRGRKHVNVPSHYPLRRERFESNWLLDLWMARELGSSLYGPRPKSVFGAISPDELREAAQRRLREWAMWATDVPEKDVDWFNQRCQQAYVVETMCRGLHTAATGAVSTKPAAVAWARAGVPEEWRPLIEWSQQHRADGADDEAMVPDVLRFIAWAADSTA